MAFDTFSPPVAPSQPLNMSGQPRLLKITFGDGYVQSAPDGLNAAPLQGSLSWNLLTLAQQQAIDAFAQAHIGVTFYYTLPDETTPRKWQIMSTRRTQNATTWGYDMLIDERFDL